MWTHVPYSTGTGVETEISALMSALPTFGLVTVINPEPASISKVVVGVKPWDVMSPLVSVHVR